MNKQQEQSISTASGAGESMKYKVGDKVWILSHQAIKRLSEQCVAIVDPSIYEIAGTIRTITKVYEGGIYYLVNDYPIAITSRLFAKPLEECEAIDASETIKQVNEGVRKNYVKAKKEDLEKINEWVREYDKRMEQMKKFYKGDMWPDGLPMDMQVLSEAFTQSSVMATGVTLPDGYEFRDENGNVINATKIVLEKRKKEYPKTYEDCIMLALQGEGYNRACLLVKLEKLLTCRNAYWKIAGEEMGLGKPWEPDYDSGIDKFGIIFLNGVVQESNPTTNWERHLNKILDFPIREMRDAFYENFKELIESCKELI